MSKELGGFGNAGNGKKLYTAKAHAQTVGSSSCAFCWFVLQLNPTLGEMSPRDTITFREHLKRTHGLVDGIQA